MKVSPTDLLLLAGLLFVGGFIIAAIGHFIHVEYELWKVRRAK